ncbi:MAG TPA: hypothetical protein GX699_05245 [Firmicutes bacterium]|jgi:hypothetical protein|nr:hypothetical protein [Bacillota bacterium]
MHDKVLAALLSLTALLNIADYIFTLRAVHVLGKPEANPVIDSILHTPWFPIYKVIFVPLCICFLWYVRDKVRYTRLIPLGAAVSFAVYAVLTGWHIYMQFFT